MRSRGMTVALCLSVAAVAGAAGCYARARALHADAEWLMARGQAQAQEYASSFDGAFADQQLASFEERRVTLEHAQLWQLLEKLLVLLSVLGAFSSYVLYLFRRLRDQLVEATSEADPGGSGPLFQGPR